MFYSGGNATHIVGIAQKFGRICGTSRPDIQRRVVYCADSVYEDYKSYLKNQEQIFKKLSGAGMEMTMAEILAESGQALPVRRSLDRPALKIVNKEYSSSSSSTAGSDSDTEYDTNKMHRLVDSWKSGSNNTAVARLFREMIASDGNKMESTLVREIVGANSYGAVAGRNTSLYWNLIFKKEGRHHYIRREVLSYLSN
jgi:hypothetical protein